MWFKGNQFSSLLATNSRGRKIKEDNGYKGDATGEFNVEKSKIMQSVGTEKEHLKYESREKQFSFYWQKL